MIDIAVDGCVPLVRPLLLAHAAADATTLRDRAVDDRRTQAKRREKEQREQKRREQKRREKVRLVYCVISLLVFLYVISLYA